MNKKIFIAATRQNDGKTVISLGLLKVLKEYFKNVGFMKPVGQKYIFVDKLKVDIDAVLIKKVFNMRDNLEHMNPVAVEEGFTRKYIENPERDKYIKKIKQSFEIISRDKDFILKDIILAGLAGYPENDIKGNDLVVKITESDVDKIEIAARLILNLASFKYYVSLIS